MKFIILGLACVGLAFFILGIAISLLVWSGPPPFWVLPALFLVVPPPFICGSVVGFWLLETGPKFNHHAP